eukprot:gene10209-39485_t
MSHYAAVGGVTTEQLHRIERRFLTDMDWRLHVTPAQLALYTESLRMHMTKRRSTAAAPSAKAGAPRLTPKDAAPSSPAQQSAQRGRAR